MLHTKRDERKWENFARDVVKTFDKGSEEQRTDCRQKLRSERVRGKGHNSDSDRRGNCVY